MYSRVHLFHSSLLHFHSLAYLGGRGVGKILKNGTDDEFRTCSMRQHKRTNRIARFLFMTVISQKWTKALKCFG